MCDHTPPSKQITTLHTYTTPYNADSVEWCPHAPHHNLFVCANYQLKDSEGKSERVGCILLFALIDNDLKLFQTVNTTGILDQKWCHNRIDNRSILGVVTADKSLEIYFLDEKLLQLKLITQYRVNGDDQEILLLSLDWSTGKHPSNEPEIVCTDSKGNIHRLRLKSDELEEVGKCHAHKFEAWIAAFYYWDPNIFFSGGDDCRFLKFDQRVGLEPIYCNKSHETGVTAMHSNSKKEHVVATGSYDTNIRIWDVRFMKHCTKSIKMPGPLWRLKWDPFHCDYLLSACMLGGVHILDTKSETLDIADSYYNHKNIAYGADWSFLPPLNNSTIIASCSFYDNLLCVSKIRLE